MLARQPCVVPTYLAQHAVFARTDRALHRSALDVVRQTTLVEAVIAHEVYGRQVELGGALCAAGDVEDARLV